MFSSETPDMSQIKRFQMQVTTRPDIEANEVVPATLVSSSDSFGETNSGNDSFRSPHCGLYKCIRMMNSQMFEDFKKKRKRKNVILLEKN